MLLQEEPDLNANRTSLHGTHRHTHTHNRRCASVGVGLSRRSRVRGPCERLSGETATGTAYTAGCRGRMRV
jgi:hypothetical protein